MARLPRAAAAKETELTTPAALLVLGAAVASTSEKRTRGDLGEAAAAGAGAFSACGRQR